MELVSRFDNNLKKVLRIWYMSLGTKAVELQSHLSPAGNNYIINWILGPTVVLH